MSAAMICRQQLSLLNKMHSPACMRDAIVRLKKERQSETMDDEKREMFFEYERLKAILEDLEKETSDRRRRHE